MDDELNSASAATPGHSGPSLQKKMQRVAVACAGLPLAWLMLPRLAADESVEGLLPEIRRGLAKSLGLRSGERLAVGAAAAVVVWAGVGAAVWAGEWCLLRLTSRCELDSRDEAHRWVLEWLSSAHAAQSRSGSYSASVGRSSIGGGGKGAASAATASEEGEVVLSPGEGTHWLRSPAGSWVWVTRRVRSWGGGGGGGARLETLTCTVLGGREKLMRFLADCGALCRVKDQKRTLVYTGGEHGSWNMARARLRRPLQTVVLAPPPLDLVRDAREFFASEEWYAERGIPWRRGYLLFGPPGTGKSSFVAALAGALAVNVYCIALGSANVTDEALLSLVVAAPRRAILLIEDIDAAFCRAGQEDPSSKRHTRLSLSGLLNALDGVAAQEGSLLILTTNHPEQLPDRLVRSGRIDVRCAFGLADQTQIRGMFRLFFGEGCPVEEEAFVAACPVNAWSCSDVQAVLLSGKGAPQDAVAELRHRVGRDDSIAM